MKKIINFKFSILNFDVFLTSINKHFHNLKSKIQNLELCACICVPFLFCVPSAWAKAPAVKETAPLKITVPVFDEKTLSCGMKVLFLRNDSMPLVQANLYMPGGFCTDPVGKEGLISLVSSALRNGGAGTLSPEAFDKALENKAASMSASAEQEDFTAGFNCLSEDLPDILDLLADMLLRPKFDAKRLETDKANIVDSLRRLVDTPDALSRVLFYKALFGKSFYGRWASPENVARLTRGDVAQFYQKSYGPEGAVLALSGKFDEVKVSGQLEKLFSGWKKATKPSAGERRDALIGPRDLFLSQGCQPGLHPIRIDRHPTS